MKILHTSDWHLGHNLYGYDRKKDHIDFLNQLRAIIKEEIPDALLVSGDIYDVSNPPTNIVSIFNDFILELRHEFPLMAIIITAGNHDSASKVEVYREVWKELDIDVIGKIEKNGRDYSFKNNLIEVKGKGVIVAIPFVNRAYMSIGSEENIPEENFFSQIAKEVSNENHANLPIVLMAHITVNGSDTEGHKQPSIGNINSVNDSIFDKMFDYVALGHIHKPQTVDSFGRIRYSGSPIAISFDEEFTHSVSIVEIEKGIRPVIRTVNIDPSRPLITFPTQPVSFGNAIKMLKKFPSEKECFIRLNVEQEDDLPADCEEQAIAAVTDKKCLYCTIKYLRPNKENSLSERFDLRLDDFMDLKPTDVAMTLFKSLGIGEETSKELQILIKEIEEDIINKQREED